MMFLPKLTVLIPRPTRSLKHLLLEAFPTPSFVYSENIHLMLDISLDAHNSRSGLFYFH